MRYLALMLALTGCGLLGSAPVQPPVPAVVPQNVAVVTALKHTMLFHLASGGSCTAENIGGGRVVTARHCVEDLPIGTKTEHGLVAFKSPTSDFAILMDESLVNSPAPGLRAPRLGEHIYAVGYPMQFLDDAVALQVTDGVVAGPTYDGELLFTAWINHGSSGGGVWAEDGSLVGISVSALETNGEPVLGVSYMVSAEDVEAALL